MFRGQNGTIFVEVALLTIIVLLVDEALLRAFMAFVPAMLLAQRALSAAGDSAGESVRSGERRVDDPARKHIDDFLTQFREFYSTCHLLGSGEISSGEALERTTQLERNLNRLLAQVTAATKARAGLATPSGAWPIPR